MSERRLMPGAPDPPDCSLDAAPYVLGALEPVQARAFVRHLECCAVCRDEVAALAPVLEALPASAPVRHVRGAFRRRMLRAVRAEPKPTKAPVPAARRRAMMARRSAPAGWLALGLAIAAAALVVELGGSQLGGSQLGESHPARSRAISATVGSAVLRVDNDGHGELIVRHLPALPADRVYELWLEPRGQTARPSTLFAVSARDRADLGVPGDLHGVSRLLVTVEPRGGSLAPTTPAVIQVALSNVRRS